MFFLPYCLERQPDGSYIVTNRQTQPVGTTEGVGSPFDGFPVRVLLPHLTDEIAARLSFNGNDDLEKIFL
jgi:hypothetical protein